MMGFRVRAISSVPCKVRLVLDAPFLGPVEKQIVVFAIVLLFVSLVLVVLVVLLVFLFLSVVVVFLMF